MTGIEVDLAELKNRYGSLPVWGVVSSFAADSFYTDLTLDQAETLVRRETTNERGRSATLVLVVKSEDGSAL
jgi:hypothetical protein